MTIVQQAGTRSSRLHVKNTNPIFNFFLKRALPYLEPTRYDKVLQQFSNYGDLRAEA